jgi:hypothetical protein
MNVCLKGEVRSNDTHAFGGMSSEQSKPIQKKHNMKTMLFAFAVLTVALASQNASAQYQQLIYQQSFTGNGDPLTGTAVETAVSPESGFWSDQTGRFKLDGSVAGVWFSSATLPFTPTSGFVYTLEATLNATSGDDWNQLYMGFFDASGEDGGSTTVFDTASSWMGMDASGHWLVNGSHEGTTAGPLTFKIVLDTTGAQWTSKFYVNDFYISWKDQTFTTNPTISTVGFGTQSTTGGAISNFSLNAVSSLEPPTLTLLSFSTPVFEAGETTMNAQFTGNVGATYVIEYSPLLDGSWTPLAPVSTDGGTFSVNITETGDHTATWGNKLFFRAKNAD